MSDSAPVFLPGTVEEVLGGDDASSYRLLIAVPDEVSPPSGFPVLYLLDGAAFFGTLVEMVRLRRNRPAMTAVEACIVVGIAHPGVHPYDRERRERELTPPPSGQSDAFLGRLVGEIHPRVEERFPADAGRRTLIGHSLAGCFVLNAFLSSPGSHLGYVAISPSIWSQREHVDRGVEGLADRLDPDARPRRLMVTAAQYDQEIAPWQTAAPDQAALRRRRGERRMVDEARRICGRVEAVAGPRVVVRHQTLAGEDHASVVPVALSRCLRFVAGVEDRERS